jgi:hypothetical protein
MATAQDTSTIDQIGEIAGQVWHLLDEQGSLSLARIVKDIDAPRDVVMQAIGWLAREDKIAIEEEARSKVVSLRERLTTGS